MFTPLIYHGPIFETICQYLNWYDYHNLIQTDEWIRQLAIDYRNLTPVGRAERLAKRAMRRWSILRMVTRTRIPYWFGQTHLGTGSLIRPFNKRCWRIRPIPIIHRLHLRIEYVDAFKCGLYKSSEFICNIAWHFYNVDEQPIHCSLWVEIQDPVIPKCTSFILIDDHFNGDFNEYLPINYLRSHQFYIGFPEKFNRKNVYLCVKYADITKELDRNEAFKNTAYWTANNGAQYNTRDFSIVQEKVQYTPFYKQLVY